MSSGGVKDFVEIDGAHGEGGGQILRTALSLSVITLRHHSSGAALDRHLGDQILLPLCLLVVRPASPSKR